MPIHRLSLVSLLALALAGGLAEAAESPTRPLRALLITGGCCHDYPGQTDLLTAGISARANVEWTVWRGDGNRVTKLAVYEKEDWAEAFDVIVHNECYGGVKDVAFVEKIARAHRDGKPAVMIHCSAHSYRAAATDAWRECLGITSRSHEKSREFRVTVADRGHPILRTFPDTWDAPKDELYKVEKEWPNLHRLARAYGEDTKKDHTVVWTNTYGKGRVFATTLGHGAVTVSHEVFLDLVARGLLWSCGQLDDEGLPREGYGPTGEKPRVRRLHEPAKRRRPKAAEAPVQPGGPARAAAS